MEVIRNLVESYMSIVTKATRDLVPKMITCLIIKNTKNYIFEELLVNVYAHEDQVTIIIFSYRARWVQNSLYSQVELLEESPEEVKKRTEKMAMFQACKAALDIIGDCNMKFNTTSTNTEEEIIYAKPMIAPNKPSIASKKSKHHFIIF